MPRRSRPMKSVYPDRGISHHHRVGVRGFAPNPRLVAYSTNPSDNLRRRLMKTKWATILITALLAAAPFVHGQDTTSADKDKSAGTDVKSATKTAAKDTEKGADKTGSAVKTGAKDVGHDVKKGTEKTVDAVK